MNFFNNLNNKIILSNVSRAISAANFYIENKPEFHPDNQRDTAIYMIEEFSKKFGYPTLIDLMNVHNFNEPEYFNASLNGHANKWIKAYSLGGLESEDYFWQAILSAYCGILSVPYRVKKRELYWKKFLAVLFDKEIEEIY